MELIGKTVVLTGASRGIGVAIARALAQEGAHLVLAARKEDALKATAAMVRECGGQATVVPTDVTCAEGRAALLAAAGPVDVLINNAGVEVPVAVTDQSEADITQQIEVNLTAALALTRMVLPSMIARGAGAVVQVSSMSGKAPTPYNAVYTATKHGLVGFTASLRIELHGTGVTTGVVCPGFVAEAGMFHDTGVAPPRAMKAVPLAKVVRGVRKAIDGAGEVLVTPAPMRPLLAIGQLIPGIDGPLLRWLGILDVLKERARAVASARSEE